MEVVLQWLDELDDVVFTVAFALLLKRHALRRSALGVGMASALTIAGCELSAAPLGLISALTAVATVSLAVWSIGAAAAALARVRETSIRA